MNSLTLLIVAACCFALAYRYYAVFLAAKVAMVDAGRPTPAHELHDGKDYVPTNRFVLFGHHFAAISGPGPLIGPVLAAQWGLLPSALWIILGATLAGAVHDFIILAASVRCRGRSLSEIAGEHIGPAARLITSIAILFIIMCALAGLGLAMVNALAESIWATFAIAASIPIALLVGLYLHVFRPGKVVEASVIGVALLFAAVIFGGRVPNLPWGHYFLLTELQLKLALPIYGFIASTLPVWLLLCPRDYLNSYLKIGAIALLAVGIVIVHPDLKLPLTTPFLHGGGVILPGSAWPFVSITIMCGAISGFHALVSSGTTPKMINSEGDLRFIGYGAMLVEGFVAVTALIAAGSMLPYDYFAINAKDLSLIPAWAGTSGNLQNLTRLVGEQNLVGRTGGAVSLAVGMSQIFSGIPGLRGLMAYWYHFAIMFEALFILTALDTGTRIARFIVNEFVRLRRGMTTVGSASYPTILLTGALASLCWGYLLFGNDIATIWPMFGLANQLLAAIALAIGTIYILRTSRSRYALTTALPLGYVFVTALYAGWLNVTGNYLPKQAYLNAALTIAMMVMCVLITALAAITARRLLRARPEPVAAAAEEVRVSR